MGRPRPDPGCSATDDDEEINKHMSVSERGVVFLISPEWINSAGILIVHGHLY
jgi:hypothetical protein